MIAAMKDLVAASPVTVVFDHFGNARAELGVQQPGFADLVELVRSGKAYVKISGAYRVSKRPDYGDVAPLAKALIAANPDRILWGTDWPHPESRDAPRPEADRGHADAQDRRRSRDESASRVGARCGDAQEDPGGQPGAPLQVLNDEGTTP